MARKKIREHDSKRLLREHIKRLAGLDLPLKTVQVRGIKGDEESISAIDRSSSRKKRKDRICFTDSLSLDNSLRD